MASHSGAPPALPQRSRMDYQQQQKHRDSSIPTSFPSSIPSYPHIPSDSSTPSSLSPSKRSSLTLNPALAPSLPSSHPPLTLFTSLSSTSSAPPTTTHSRFPTLVPRHPSSAQGPRVRVQREAEDDDDSSSSSHLSVDDRGREELERIQRDREDRQREELRRAQEEREKSDRLLAAAQKAARVRLQAAAVERNRRKDDEKEMREVVAQVQQREERQRREDRERQRPTPSPRPTSPSPSSSPSSTSLPSFTASLEAAGEEERAKERRMQRSLAGLPHRSDSHHRASAVPLPSPSPAPVRRPTRALEASTLPSHPSYPPHIHALLVHSFSTPLQRLFRHYHSRAPSASALAPSYMPLAPATPALSSADFLLLLSDLSLTPTLLSKPTALRIYTQTLQAPRVRGEPHAQTGLEYDRFLQALWLIARTVAGAGGMEENAREDVRMQLVTLEYMRHHCTAAVLGKQVRLHWPQMSLEEAVAVYVDGTAPQPMAPVPKVRTGERRREPRETPPPVKMATPEVVADGQGVEDAEARAKKERKRLRLKERVERYRREVEEKERQKADEERRKREDDEAREADKRRREERVREDERQRIAEFKAKRRGGAGGIAESRGREGGARGEGASAGAGRLLAREAREEEEGRGGAEDASPHLPSHGGAG